MDLTPLFRLLPLKTWLMILAAIALLIAVLAWGQSRYDAGVEDTDAKWKAAGEKLARQARAAATEADRREARRIEDHQARVAEEREKIDEAVAAGDSPLDVLFGGM